MDSKSRIQAWPFLVSRNKTVDYRTVVAPDFMIDARAAGLLANKTSGDLSERPRNKLIDTSLGLLTLAYRVVPATEQGMAYLDEYGRPILWIEGVVLKGDFSGHAIPLETLQKIHTNLVRDYQEFWNIAHPIVKRSSAMDLSLENSNIMSDDSSSHRSEPDERTKARLGQLLEQKLQLEKELLDAEQQYSKGMKYVYVGIVLVPLLGLGLVPIFWGRSIAHNNRERQGSLSRQIQDVNDEIFRLRQSAHLV